MHTEDQTITDTIAAYERLRAFVDERIAENMPEEVDVDDAVRSTLMDMDISEYVNMQDEVESAVEEAISNELDSSLDTRIVEGMENYMSQNFDIDAQLENADPVDFVREALPPLLNDPKVVDMIRTALAEVPAPEKTED